MILAVRTDSPVASLSLYRADGDAVAQQEHEVGRQMALQLPSLIEDLLAEHQLALHDLTGIVFFAGPGSFTGLRIGAAVVNALSYGLQLPIVAARADNWQTDGLARLAAGEDQQTVTPFYGAEAHITQPRK